MRLALARLTFLGALASSCGGQAEESGSSADRPPGERPDEGAPSGGGGGADGGVANGGTSAGGLSQGGVSGGGVSSGGVSSGGVSSGGVSGGGVSSGGAPSGGTSTGAFGGQLETGGSGGLPVAPEDFGHVDWSCGAYVWSLDGETYLDCRVGAEHEGHPDCIIVDCTAHGDDEAYCVFSNHCGCSEGFACENDPTRVGSECEPRVSCTPAE